MQIYTFPRLNLRSLGVDGDTRGLTTCSEEALEDLRTPRTTDAMLVPYSVPGAPAFPRIQMAALPYLESVGHPPVLSWAVLDIDNEGHRPWANTGVAAMALHGARSIEGLPSPVGYTTRAGYRLMWPLDPPLPVRLARSFLRQLSERLPEEVDPCSYEWNRQMRLPLATRDGIPLQSVLFLDDPIALDPHALGFELTEEAAARAVAADLPDAPVTLEWKDWARAADMPWAHLGRPVPEGDGSCYRTARTALARIAARGDYDDPHTLASFLWASVEATEGSTLDLSELWKLAEWVAAKQEQVTKDEEESRPLPQPEAPTSEAWKQAAKALSGKHYTLYTKAKDGVPLTPSKSRYLEYTYKAARALIQRTLLPADTVYRLLHASARAQRAPTPEELWAKCLELEAEKENNEDNTAALVRVFTARYPLTVASPEGSLFQLDTTTTPYSYRRTSQLLIDHDYTNYSRPNLPFEADVDGAPLRAILAKYGGRVDKITYMSGMDQSRYNHEDRSMVSGVHQLAKVRAQQHPEVGTWLRLLGSTDPEGLLDWLACVTYTQTQPICALYLAGPPSTGKTLLARGIAGLWAAPPIDYNKVVSSGFNADMLLCPLLFADEGIIVNRNNAEQASQDFRNLVAGGQTVINAKFQQPVPLQGAMRVVVAANDDSGLPFRESLGAEGIAAIVQRVLYVRAHASARTYLEAMGGRETLVTWAPPDNSPGKIAEHLMWLRDNREVRKTDGQRFLVQGKETAWHRSFGARQGLKPGVLQVVKTLVDRLAAGVPSHVYIGVDAEEQVVWVARSSLVAAWDEYSRSRRATPADITAALRQLATRNTTVRFGTTQKRAWALPFQAFEDAEICEAQELMDIAEGVN